jgi:hypothetical protein
MGTTEKRQHRKHVVRGTVNRESWLRFIDIHLRLDDHGVLTLNGCHINESARRALYRWRKEGATPVWFVADSFLCKGEMIWTDFEHWCYHEGLPLWEKMPPDGWD